MNFKGLTSAEVQARLKKFGPNILAEEKEHPFALFLQKFWAPVPWVLEIIIALELFLKKYPEAWIVLALLLFNAIVSFLEEGRARGAVRLLRGRLNVRAKALRDGEWRSLPAQDLVPDDIICIQMGDLIPADAVLLEGYVLVDQSALTGESLPVEPAVGQTIFAGSTVNRGEAFARIAKTGKNTQYGSAAEIVRTAKAPSHLQTTIFSIIKGLVSFDAVLICILLAYCLSTGFALRDILPFSLLLLVASVPVALPATYSLSTALGSLELAKAGVLVTRLTAIEEAAAMDVLCLDKTGTVTKNVLSLESLHSFAPFSEADLLALASFACEEAGQDPLDIAILQAAAKDARSPYAEAKRTQFIPFDPEKKFSEALLNTGRAVHKGAPVALRSLVEYPPSLAQELEKLSADGSRVLGVLYDKQWAGLIALRDTLRENSKETVKEIAGLGVAVKMFTGDGYTTARTIAAQAGIGTHALTRKDLKEKTSDEILKAEVIAEILPEDKFELIKLLQMKGHVSGMTGDGVNDAPALKQAEIGIAMSNATDVAKAAASLVLTNPGLVDILPAIKTSRKIYQRMLTYTLNKIVKTFQIAVLLSVGLMAANAFIISQLLIVLLLFANDFMTMSIATDRVGFAKMPEKWNIQKLLGVGGALAALLLAFSFAVLYLGIDYLRLSIEEIQTLIFLTLVFTGQATIYLVRERKRFWHSRPSLWMILASAMDIIIVAILAAKGILMAPLSLSIILGLLAAVCVYFVLLDFVKAPIFRIFRL